MGYRMLSVNPRVCWCSPVLADKISSSCGVSFSKEWPWGDRRCLWSPGLAAAGAPVTPWDSEGSSQGLQAGWISSSTCAGIFNCPQSSVAHLDLKSTQDSSPCFYNVSHGGGAAFQLQTRLHLVELLKTFGLCIQDFAVLSCVLVVCLCDLPRPVLAGSNCSEILEILMSRRG